MYAQGFALSPHRMAGEPRASFTDSYLVYTKLCFVLSVSIRRRTAVSFSNPLGMLRLCVTPLWVGIYIRGPIFHRIHMSLRTSILQDHTITDLPYPSVTPCLRNTILQWVPMGIFWLILPGWLYMVSKRRLKFESLSISTLFVIKMVKVCEFVSPDDR